MTRDELVKEMEAADKALTIANVARNAVYEAWDAAHEALQDFDMEA